VRRLPRPPATVVLSARMAMPSRLALVMRRSRARVELSGERLMGSLRWPVRARPGRARGDVLSCLWRAHSTQPSRRGAQGTLSTASTLARGRGPALRGRAQVAWNQPGGVRTDRRRRGSRRGASLRGARPARGRGGRKHTIQRSGGGSSSSSGGARRNSSSEQRSETPPALAKGPRANGQNDFAWPSRPTSQRRPVHTLREVRPNGWAARRRCMMAR
jgi:hypothetical protein